MASAKAFNCEIVNLSCNLGFGSSESTVSLKLVECGTPYNGSLGCVYTINVGGFSFTGVLANHEYQQSSSGLVWDVRLTDGRQSLTNVSVIMNDYYCNYNTPNLINVLALLEPSVCNFNCTDFMASFKDEGGIPMLYILRALQGQSVLLPVCGVTMYIDVSQIIPICPFYLKVNDTSSNVLNLIDQACSEAGFDFFITISGSNFVAVPINKKVAPSDGALLTLLNTISANSCSGQGNIEHRYGAETSYEPSKKFVIGENIHYLATIFKSGNDCDNLPAGGGVGGNPDIPDPDNPPSPSGIFSGTGIFGSVYAPTS